MRLMDDYLYNPNSPYYNETLYAAYLRRMLQSTALDEARKSSLKFKLELISRNNVGKAATDFTYYWRTKNVARCGQPRYRETSCCWYSTTPNAPVATKC
mgnify:FL=1